MVIQPSTCIGCLGGCWSLGAKVRTPVLEHSVTVGSAPRLTGWDAPSAVSLAIPVFTCDVPPAPTPVALNAPCWHGSTVPCQVSWTTALEASAHYCFRATGSHGSKLFRHLEDGFFQLLKALISRVDVNLTNRFGCSVENQPKFPCLRNCLLIRLLGE